MGLAEIRKQWVQLRMADPSMAGVTVHPEDGDLFSLTKQMIEKSGRIAAHIERFDQQLVTLKRELEAWSSEHSTFIEEVFLVLKGDYFLFLVVMKGKAHDCDLEDALTDLDMKLAQDPEYDLINLSVLALPAFAEEAIRSFLPSRTGLKGDGRDAQREEPPVAGQP